MNRRPLGRVLCAATAWFAVVVIPRMGIADPSRNSAAAQALYEEARRLVRAGDFAGACPKFKESYQLEPGGGTLLNLADCYEKQGRTAMAWSTFKEALVAAERDRRAERADFARQHIAGLEGRLLRLTVRVGSAPRPQGLTVLLDGSALGDAAWGLALPVDPGKHTVRAEAPGKRPFETSVDVTQGSASVDVPALEDALAPPGPAPSASAEGAATPAPASRRDEPSNAKATIGWILGGAGVAGLGVGSFFGLRAISRWNDRNAACGGGCTMAAKAAGDDANTAATIADVGLGVGVAALAVGAYLILTGSSADKPAAHEGGNLRLTASLGPQGTGLWIGGGW